MKTVDIHNHILPGVDDGASTMEEALDMLKTGLQEQVDVIVATPHYKHHKRNLPMAKRQEIYKEIQSICEQLHLPVQIVMGNELLYYEEWERALEKGELHTLGDSDYLLVEFMPQDSYRHISNGLLDILGAGLIPVLAHVERYQSLSGDYAAIGRLQAKGAKIQVNAGSVMGKAGWAIKYQVRKLIKLGLVDYIGTDAHDNDKRAMEIRKCKEYISKKYGQDYADDLCGGNALRDLDIK